jgi:PKD repeat protein
LTVSDLPVWSVDGPAAACAGQPVAFSLQTPGSAGAVTWFFSDGDTLAGRQISKTFQSAGKYQVQAFCDRSWSATKDIQIIAVPAVSLPPVPPVDVDEPISISPALDNPDGIPLKYQWDLGDGTKSDQPGISHAYRDPGEKTIRLKIEPTNLDAPCLSGVQEIRVRVNAKPEAVIEISPDTLYTGGARDEATFTAVMADASRPVVCRWDFGDQQTASGPRVKHAYGRPGLFSVQLTVWDASRKSAKKYAFTRRIQVLPR